MFRSNKILVKADLSNALSEVLSLLDPRESCIITYMPTYDRPGGDDIGVYVVEFENEQLFDPACFPMNVWDGIEDASEMDGILDAHVSNT